MTVKRLNNNSVIYRVETKMYDKYNGCDNYDISIYTCPNNEVSEYDEIIKDIQRIFSRDFYIEDITITGVMFTDGIMYSLEEPIYQEEEAS